ncbi:hypothetical protein PsAD37_04715 [Pseudovibrio sp. Ad37]|nr:hypothetical protein PsAD37_04715 [Pseudovibrio sp. Ad37]
MALYEIGLMHFSDCINLKYTPYGLLTGRRRVSGCVVILQG